MSGCVVLSEDDLLRLAEAGLSGDRERFLAELRDLGMPPFLILLAKQRHPDFVGGDSYERGYERGYFRGREDTKQEQEAAS